MKNFLKLAALASALVLAHGAQASTVELSRDGQIALTGNNTSPANWRLTDGQTFNGKTFDGVGRLLFDTPAGGYVCSATLLKGGYFAVTAAHCADEFTSMTAEFGLYGNVAKETRTVTQAMVHSGWTGALSTGADIAILRLDRQVTSIEGFNISTTNDLGKDFLIMGYGTTSVGSVNTGTNWNEWGWGHYGYNTADVDGKTFNTAIFGNDPNDDKYGMEYIADYDSLTNKANHNTLQRLAAITGNQWSSSQGLGMNEALIAGGDSGGGDFVWNGSEWLLSGVHSWGWQICPTSWGCDIGKANSSSWGDLSGSTAVFSHAGFIAANAVPEPTTLALVPMALFAIGAVRRRRQQA
jgi:hypothetical protein